MKISPGKIRARARTAPAPAACTIIFGNYLSYARILARSFARYEPNSRFYVLVVDELPKGARVGPGVRVIRPEELRLPGFFEMCFKYDVTELSTAVKPSLLSLLFEHYGEKQVIYFDPDILIMRPLDELHEAMAAADTVLTPHLLRPIPLDGHKPSEQDILLSGTYNLGFIALKRSAQTAEFLAWWAERLKDQCRIDHAKGLFTDQKWVDLVPSLFPSTVLLRDPTYNVAYWNLHERAIKKRKGGFFTGERPLAFFHFSGFNPGEPDGLSKHQTRTQIRKGSALAELLGLYVDLQMRNGYRTCSRGESSYTRFSNGIPIQSLLRQVYLELDTPTRAKLKNPFEADGPTSFFSWATHSPREGQRLSPFLECLLRLRYDVAVAFPEATGKDRPRFLHWARTQGAKELEYDARLVPPEEEPMAVGHSGPALTDSPVERAGPAASHSTTPPDYSFGVNLSGYFASEKGVGEGVRSDIRGLKAAGIPYVLNNFPDEGSSNPDRSFASFSAENPYPVNLVHINADQVNVFEARMGKEYFRSRYNIGYWVWELADFPREWWSTFEYFNEIWVPSNFALDAISRVAPIPVVRIPHCLSEKTPPRRRARSRFGLPKNQFIFFFMFDFHSFVERKNPFGLIEAFRQAFPSNREALLVLKCSHSESSPTTFHALEKAVHGSNIRILDGVLSREEIDNLLSLCDCYVSLHRSEGFGLTIAEAMKMGKPVIATSYSANMDFMTASNSLLVKYRLMEIQRDHGPYRKGCVWADPDLEHAASLMRLVYENPALAGKIGRQAQQDIRHSLVPSVVGKLFRERLLAIRERVKESAPSEHGDHGDRAQGKEEVAPVTNKSQYPKLVALVREVVETLLPPDATVVVVSKGDDELLKLGNRKGWHFPQTSQGKYAGYYPADSAVAIAHLEALKAGGGQYLLLPVTAFWWLDHYGEFRQHLDRHYRRLVDLKNICVIYALELRPVDYASAMMPANLTPYEQLLHQIRNTVRTAVPEKATVLVVSKGDDELLKLAGRSARHFPQTQHGDYAGFHPADSLGAIVGLEAARARGAEFLLFPNTAFWWFEDYAEFRRHLDGLYRRIWNDQWLVMYQLRREQDKPVFQVQERIDYLLAILHQRRELAGADQDRLKKLEDGFGSFEADWKEHIRATDARFKELAESATRRFSESMAARDELGAVIEQLRSALSRVNDRFAARPYIGRDLFGVTGDLTKPMGYGPEIAGVPIDFTALFRGSVDFITERQREYLPFFTGRTRVVDLGCGRGEFLYLLKKMGIQATGVELNQSLVEQLEKNHRDVVRADAVEYLRSLPEGSVDGIFSAQVIEHLEPDRLVQLLGLARSRLRKDGVFIAETVNPENFEALKTFHVDPTHKAPIYPQVLLHLCRQAGFPSARIFYPLGGGFTQVNYEKVGEYAVVAEA